MGRLGRNVYRKKLGRYLSHSFDEPIISLVSAVVAAQSGNRKALTMIQGFPPEAMGAELGSPKAKGTHFDEVSGFEDWPRIVKNCPAILRSSWDDGGRSSEFRRI